MGRKPTKTQTIEYFLNRLKLEIKEYEERQKILRREIEALSYGSRLTEQTEQDIKERKTEAWSLFQRQCALEKLLDSYEIYMYSYTDLIQQEAQKNTFVCDRLYSTYGEKFSLDGRVLHAECFISEHLPQNTSKTA